MSYGDRVPPERSLSTHTSSSKPGTGLTTIERGLMTTFCAAARHPARRGECQQRWRHAGTTSGGSEHGRPLSTATRSTGPRPLRCGFLKEPSPMRRQRPHRPRAILAACAPPSPDPPRPIRRRLAAFILLAAAALAPLAPRAQTARRRRGPRRPRSQRRRRRRPLLRARGPADRRSRPDSSASRSRCSRSPPSRPIGLYILQPDAIADNQIVVVGDEVRNYTFLTNQVSLFDASTTPTRSAG
jgi:hypothetical protein